MGCCSAAAYQNHETGFFNEVKIMEIYSKMGYTISKPINCSARYDFLAEKNGRAVRVQVKTASYINRDREIACKINAPYSRDDCDVVILYFEETDTPYFLPVEIVEKQFKKHVRLRLFPYLRNVKEEIALPAENFLIFIG
jgi:hypothetical protein